MQRPVSPDLAAQVADDFRDEPTQPPQKRPLPAAGRPAVASVPPEKALVVVRPSQSIAISEPRPAPRLSSKELGTWQELWLSLQERKWRTLAVIPAGPGLDDAILQLARTLQHIGTEHLKQPIRVLDHRGVSLGQVELKIKERDEIAAEGGRAMVVIDAIAKSPSATRLASTTDAAVLCFLLGKSELSAAKKAVDAVGKDRFLGSIAIRPRAPKN